jgi:CheY-like chemotaxis protein
MPLAYRLSTVGFVEDSMLSVTPSESRTTKNPSVLLVEDEVLIRANLAEELRELNFSVIEAANAQEAWSYLQSGNRPDLVFSDVRMPGPYDGLELARRIQDHFPEIKVILTSGNLGPAQKPAGVLFLPKPYRIEHAILTAKRQLGLH